MMPEIQEQFNIIQKDFKEGLEEFLAIKNKTTESMKARADKILKILPGFQASFNNAKTAYESKDDEQSNSNVDTQSIFESQAGEAEEHDNTQPFNEEEYYAGYEYYDEVEEEDSINPEELTIHLNSLTKEKEELDSAQAGEEQSVSQDNIPATTELQLIESLQANHSLQLSLSKMQSRAEYDKTIFERDIAFKDSKIQDLEKRVQAVRDESAAELAKQKNSFDTQQAKLQTTISQLNKELESRGESLDIIKGNYEKLNEVRDLKLKQLENQIQDYNSKAVLQKKHVASLDEKIQQLENQIKAYDDKAALYDEHIASLGEKNKQLEHESSELRQKLTESKKPVLKQKNPITLKAIGELLNNKLANTNSTGIVDILTYIDTLQLTGMNETDKLAYLSAKMREIGSGRRDNGWSKSHFFGKGRHDGVQTLYNLFSEETFSLNDKKELERFIDLVGEKNREFTHQP